MNYAPRNPALSLKLEGWRSRLLLVLLCLMFFGLAARAAYLQGVRHDFLRQKGEARYSRVIDLPANRGVVSTGMYRFVRHPIYLGYLITHVGFVAANPADWNLIVLAAADLALMMRAVCEEQTLAQDEAYRAYMQRVRWRVIPGVF